MNKSFIETAEFYRRLKKNQFIAIRIPYPKRKAFLHAQYSRSRQRSILEIWNKHTKELVDLEVRRFFTIETFVIFN